MARLKRFACRRRPLLCYSAVLAPVIPELATRFTFLRTARSLRSYAIGPNSSSCLHLHRLGVGFPSSQWDCAHSNNDRLGGGEGALMRTAHNSQTDIVSIHSYTSAHALPFIRAERPFNVQRDNHRHLSRRDVPRMGFMRHISHYFRPMSRSNFATLTANPA